MPIMISAPEDRIALTIGKLVMEREALKVQNEELSAELAQAQAQAPKGEEGRSPKTPRRFNRSPSGHRPRAKAK